tara:strand:- start:335 stop:604 length:270 start_codon:yes stop_codon:yes gene_type:complete
MTQTHTELAAAGYNSVCVHTMAVYYFDEEGLHVAAGVSDWQRTPAGQFIKEHSPRIDWSRGLQLNSYHIYAYLTRDIEMFWKLKFGKDI